MNKIIAAAMGASTFAAGVLATPPYYNPGITQRGTWSLSKGSEKK